MSEGARIDRSTPPGGRGGRRRLVYAAGVLLILIPALVWWVRVKDTLFAETGSGGVTAPTKAADVQTTGRPSPAQPERSAEQSTPQANGTSADAAKDRARAALEKALDAWVGGEDDYSVQPPELQDAVIQGYSVDAVVPFPAADKPDIGRLGFIGTSRLLLLVKGGGTRPYSTRHVIYVDRTSAGVVSERMYQHTSGGATARP